jgi:hypothetical protein
MADITIATVDASQARGDRVVVPVSASVVYAFFLDVTTEDLFYAKSTDGGATYGTPVQINGDTNPDTFSVWYDRWTPGDTTGTKIHIGWVQTSADGTRYRSLDTNGDVFGTQITISNLTSAIDNSAEVWCSIAKALSGHLGFGYCADGGDERGWFVSEDNGATWGTDLNVAGFVEDGGGSGSPDRGSVWPATGTGDDDDFWLLWQDASANELTLKLWDHSALGMAESSAILTFAENVTDLTGGPGWKAGIRLSDGHLILAAVSEYDTATADFRVFDIGGTASITELTAITTNVDDIYFPAVCIDPFTDDIYVAFNGLRDGSEDLGTATKVYYVVSADGGTSWSAGSTAYMEGTAEAVVQVWTPPTGPLFYVVWRTGTAFKANAVNAVEFAAGAAAPTGVVVVTRFHDIQP